MRKLFSLWMILLAGLGIIVIQPTSAQSNGGEDLPRVNGTYFKSGNPYYNAGYRGQCTWYVWGRARETGWNVGFTGNASGYYNGAQTNGGKDMTPQIGAIMCLPNLSGFGHVSYVVQVNNFNSWVVEEYNVYSLKWDRETITRGTGSNSGKIQGQLLNWTPLQGFVHPPH